MVKKIVVAGLNFYFKVNYFSVMNDFKLKNISKNVLIANMGIEADN